MRTFGLLAGALAAALWAAPAAAEPLAGTPRYQPIAPALTEALAAIEDSALVGVFLFVAPGDAPVAFAAYLLRDHAALKRFVKKVEQDAKRVKVISRWDKLVCLHLVGMGVDSHRPAGGKTLSKKWVARVQDLTLSQSAQYQDIVDRRGGGR